MKCSQPFIKTQRILSEGPTRLCNNHYTPYRDVPESLARGCWEIVLGMTPWASVIAYPYARNIAWYVQYYTYGYTIPYPAIPQAITQQCKDF